jgi:hypothetical protein
MGKPIARSSPAQSKSNALLAQSELRQIASVLVSVLLVRSGRRIVIHSDFFLQRVRTFRLTPTIAETADTRVPKGKRAVMVPAVRKRLGAAKTGALTSTATPPIAEAAELYAGPTACAKMAHVPVRPG